MVASTPRSLAISLTRASTSAVLPLTISLPQWVTMARRMPASLHQLSWVRTGVCPIRWSSRRRIRGRFKVAPSPTNSPNARQRRLALFDRDDVRDVEDHDPTGAHAIADRRGTQRMLDRKGLEGDPFDAHGPARLDHMAVRDRPSLHLLPGFGRGMDRTARAALDQGVVRMGMGDEHGARRHVIQPAPPVRAAVDHDVPVVVGHQERGVAAMDRRACVNVAACAEESELHRVCRFPARHACAKSCTMARQTAPSSPPR